MPDLLLQLPLPCYNSAKGHTFPVTTTAIISCTTTIPNHCSITTYKHKPESRADLRCEGQQLP